MKKTKRQVSFKNIPLLVFVLIFSNCTTRYYLCFNYEPIKVYGTKNTQQPAFIIPSGKQLVVESKRRKYRQIRYGVQKGYIVERSFPNEWEYSPTDLKYLVFNSDSTYTDVRYARVTPIKPVSGTTPLSTTSNTTSGGTVNVKGYYRKDGTYVRPHTRSAPRRKG